MKLLEIILWPFVTSAKIIWEVFKWTYNHIVEFFLALLEA